MSNEIITQPDEQQSTIKCGIIMPISPIEDCSKEHWNEVKKIISDAIIDAGFEPNLVSDADDSGVIQKRIVQNIYQNEMLVCDVSCKNANVMFELGMRLAFDKPTIIIMDDCTPYSFDTAPIEHLSYPRNLSYFRITDFKHQLSEKIKGTYNAAKQPDYTTFLKHFGEFKTASIKPKEVALQEFVSAKFDELTNQIKDLRMSRPYSHSRKTNEQLALKLVEDYIDKFCRDSNITSDKLAGTPPDSEIRRKLYDTLVANPVIRDYCESPTILREYIARNILPF